MIYLHPLKHEHLTLLLLWLEQPHVKKWWDTDIVWNYEKIAANKLYNHVVWSPIIAHKNIQTWLYCNTNGEIILFLAPIYPFFLPNR